VGKSSLSYPDFRHRRTPIMNFQAVRRIEKMGKRMLKTRDEAP